MGAIPICSFVINAALWLLQKESWLYITDNTNVRWIRIFHLYKGFHRKIAYNGFFVKGPARIVEPPRIEYKGFKYKYNIKGDICRSWIVRSNIWNHHKDTTSTFIKTNAGILIKKKQDPKSKYLNGPISRSIKRKKLLTLFKVII